MAHLTLIDRLVRIRRPAAARAVEAGVYPYMLESDGEALRLHLRADSSGGGVLIANASIAARLSDAGVYLARRLLDGDDPEQICDDVPRYFRDAGPEAVRDDIMRLQHLISGLRRARGRYPVFNLEDAAISGRSLPPGKPIGADVPLAGYEELAPLLERLWDEAIPHVTFIVPRDFDRAALVRLVERGEDIGMITGVRSTATAILRGGLIEDLAMAGIDHVNLHYLSGDPSLHDELLGAGDHAATLRAFAEIADNDVCPVAEIALAEQTLPGVASALGSLVTASVDNVAFFVIAADQPADADRRGALTPEDLLQTAATVEELIETYGLRGIWYPPVQRDSRVALGEQISNGPRASGDNAVRIQPDGSVVAARGPFCSAGNLHEKSWAEIQSAPAYARYVQRITSPTRCGECPGLAICAADCPRSPTGWSDDQEDVA